jgi:asparagine synthase (glutamine-hydrolysing)
MRHRGPDERGLVHVDRHATLGFNRLSIVDIERSHQPLTWPPAGQDAGPDAGRYVIVLNGQVYNYLELREELAATFDARFATNGDAEVVAAGFHHWGTGVAARLRGMFAFVIWDRQRQEAFGARDSFGIKPLHYLVRADGLFLASEKKALLDFTSGSAVDRTQLSHYLTMQFVPEPATLHPDIGRLLPGESFTYAPGAAMRRQRYRRNQFTPSRRRTSQRGTSQRRTSQRETPDIAAALRDSVAVHMRADVPVGAFLSGGIDSTAVAALAREHNPDLLTFTAGFGVDGYSEIELAQDTARRLGVTNIATVVTPEAAIEALPRIVWHLDDPVADPALVPLYFLAQEAARHVKVVLSGEGADELFGGYTIYREPLSLQPIAGLPSPLRRALRALADRLPEGVRGQSMLRRGTTPIVERYYGNARIFDDAEKARLLGGPSPRHTDVTAPLYAESAYLDEVTAMQQIDLATWLPGDILVKADRMTMAHSLELRTPFLDPVVFAAAAALPRTQKVVRRHRMTKLALRRALAGIVPDGALYRPKLGFPTPIRVWLRGSMLPWANHLLDSSGAGDLLDLRYVRSLLDEHRRGDADHSRKVWTALIFCLWHEIFIAGSFSGVASPTLAEPTRRVPISTG